MLLFSFVCLFFFSLSLSCIHRNKSLYCINRIKLVDLQVPYLSFCFCPKNCLFFFWLFDFCSVFSFLNVDCLLVCVNFRIKLHQRLLRACRLRANERHLADLNLPHKLPTLNASITVLFVCLVFRFEQYI